MRIRKNAKLSAFLQPNATPLTHNHETNLLCQLNQSPWDIITFPSTHSDSSSPSILQFDDFDIHYNVNLAANWSSVDSVGSIQSVASTKNSFESEYNKVNVDENVDDTPKVHKLYEGWQCGKTATYGNITRDDDLIDLQNNVIWATDKKPKPVSRPCRPKKRAVAIASNQNEFYYYSGFGPSWGKKRGESGTKCTTFNACDTLITSSSNVYETCGFDGDTSIEEERKKVGFDTGATKTLCPYDVRPKKEGLDCVDEEQDNKKGKVKTVKKRGRKPIKARSLKSLM